MALLTMPQWRVFPLLLVALLWLAPRHCAAETPPDALATGYAEALLAESALEDALRSLRAAVLYAEQAQLPADAAREVLSSESRALVQLRDRMQVNEARPAIEAMDLADISGRAQSSTVSVKRAASAIQDAMRNSAGAWERRGAFMDMKVLSMDTRKSLTRQFVFGALAPSPKLQSPALLEMLRRFQVQFFKPFFGQYADRPAESMATDPKLVSSYAARLGAAGLSLDVWLQPDENIGNLWNEVGEEMYLHDAEGHWLKKNRINNSINVFHPRVREEAAAWLERLASQQRNDPRIIAYELVEEAALRFDLSTPDIPATAPAYGDYTTVSQVAFSKWLREKYRSIADLNRLWKSNYGSFESVELPRQLQRRTGQWDRLEVPLLVEFQEFRAAEHAKYFRLMVAALHKANPECPVIPMFVNQLFGDPLGGVDLFRMAEAGWDVISFHVAGSFPYMYSIARYQHRPLWNDEFIWTGSQSWPKFLTSRDETGEFELRAHAAIALWRNLMWGARGFVLFNVDFPWSSPKDGGDWNNELLNSRLGNRVPRYAAAVFPQVLPKVPTFQAELFDSVVENEGLYVLEPTTSLYAATPTGITKDWGQRIESRLSQDSYRPAIVQERHVISGKQDLSSTRVLIVAAAPYVPEALAGKLQIWVARGGTLITVGPFATHDSFGNPRPASAYFVQDPPGVTTRIGRGLHVAIAFRGAPDDIVSAARAAVDRAMGRRVATVTDSRLEWMLRHVSPSRDVLVILNGDPRNAVPGRISLRDRPSRIVDLTFEGGLGLARQAAGIPVSLEPGEGRVFLLEHGPAYN